MSDGKKSFHLSRRGMLALGGGAALTPMLPLTAAEGKSAMPAVPEHDITRQVLVTEATNISTSVSPDGKFVAFDLVTGLWVVPTEGGPARRLTDELADIGQPDWAPDSKTLVYQSYRGGNFHLWTIGLEGGAPKKLTEGPFDDREPRWSPDGKKIAFASDRGKGYGIYLLDIASGAITTLADSELDEAEPAWSPDSAKVAFVTNKSKVETVDVASGTRIAAAEIEAGHDFMIPHEIHSPSFTPDGKDIIYSVIGDGKVELVKNGTPIVTGEDVFPFRVTFLANGDFIYASNGKIRRRAIGAANGAPIEFTAQIPVVEPVYKKRDKSFASYTPRQVVGIGSPVLSPDGKSIAFRALNDIYTMAIGHKPVPLTKDSFYKSDPAWSPDGKYLAYSSDRGGKLDLWLRDLASGEDRQLSHLDHAAVSAAWSPDGKSIAYLDQAGVLRVLDVASGAIKQVIGSQWEPGRPSWGPDGKTIALAAFKPYSSHYREGQSEIQTVNLETGEIAYRPAFPHRSIGTRGDDGPAWSPDGKYMAFVIGSLLHVQPVDAQGKALGEPKAINKEVTDAVSWSGDSKEILYLSNGRLRLIGKDGGPPRPVPLELTWATPRPAGKMVVSAARLWNGKSPDMRPDVDIVIEGNKIAGIVTAGAATDSSAHRVDAGNQTVIPGLIDAHTHRQMQGYSFGDRQGRLWLAYGVTTTRNPGAPAYHMVEDREAIDAGLRVGPRHFATGEAIDGGRIYYNFMRPVTEPGQMALELQRAEALSYDLIKTYVRLSMEDQKEVVEWSHKHGLHVTSHYNYPSASFGADGVEHLGATNRFGYSRTITALGAAYQDVIAMFNRGRTYRTPTLFVARALLGKDRGLVDDARTRTLFTAWEYDKLEKQAKIMEGVTGTLLMESLQRQVDQVRENIRGGGRIITGTDSPIDFTAISTHLNLRGMVKFGISPYEALLTATSVPAEYMGIPVGVVEKGFLADLVVVDGNPLANIDDAARVRQVILDGKIQTPAELMAPFANAPAAPPEKHASLAPLLQAPGNQHYWWHSAAYVERSRNACCGGLA